MSDLNLELQEELASLCPLLQTKLANRGFDPEHLLRLSIPLRKSFCAGRSGMRDRMQRNCIQGQLRVPQEGDIHIAHLFSGREKRSFQDVGLTAIARGELALCVMAGGMATRMSGVVKALLPVFNNETFLSLRLRENQKWSGDMGLPVPLWIMTSETTDQPVRGALKAIRAPAHVDVFVQDLSLRLTSEGILFRDRHGMPSIYPTGHGDLVDALRRSSLLSGFLARGGKYVWIVNLDNLGALIDPMILGFFMARGTDALVEVVEKRAGDHGGIPLYVDDRLRIVEECRLPCHFPVDEVSVFNTNTFLVRAEALQKTDFLWDWLEIEKQVDGRPVIQFERLLQELTTVLPTTYLHVPRTGIESRFLPIKDQTSLDRQRAEIEVVIGSRGIL
ncbi:UTP--glucose-1-phosphate uridylyltransferase [Pajaroellobacter abortibovis]|uniref:UTP--glucose-1-phosphate uridylyltransferase n=1 Tax=Pajaroellobacter abortibovis TaxID=1882918 RepID=A0A1L6MYW9_9BACT|nr:UTP--glucose-1-phosphate uridylyltransferase [Pajaroellobacter abortibovis]APS00690.1 hypothetical protein BCY86_08375 [Pajaroellobacter abortibovis]